MQTEFRLTKKQAEYIRNANHRWNVACGAVRSGKSYCQISYCIPYRLLERKGRRGLRVILGATRENIERNILQPLRDIYGDSAATGITSNNFTRIFGEKVYCIGADNVRQVAKIRGSEIAYCAIDEATDINPEVFEMLKSRLSLPWSCCDITTNPSSPGHWFKKFIDSSKDGVDIYCQNYTIYDNPFLPHDYVKALEAEYSGTVYFDRYILGKWTLAEGLVYPNYEKAVVEASSLVSVEYYDQWVLSVDYGTQNATAALLFGRRGNSWVLFREYRYSGRDTGRQKTDAEYVEDMLQLVHDIPCPNGDAIEVIIDPSAASFIEAMRRTGRFKVRKADNDVLNGIRCTAVAMSSGKLYISNSCEGTIKELQGYIWDTSRDDVERPVKVEDHCMDAMRYFVKTKRLVKPTTEYQSIFGG